MPLIRSVLVTPTSEEFRKPQPLPVSKKVRQYTPPICTAVRPPFVSLDLPGFEALKKGKPNSTPPICTAVCLPFVRQYASHLYGSTFEKVLGVGVTGKFLTTPSFFIGGRTAVQMGAYCSRNGGRIAGFPFLRKA